MRSQLNRIFNFFESELDHDFQYQQDWIYQISRSEMTRHLILNTLPINFFFYKSYLTVVVFFIDLKLENEIKISAVKEYIG